MPDPDDEAREEQPPERRYRPGRGGFDPHAAELAARAKYAYRQRVVLGLLLAILATGLFAGFAVPAVWWAHGAFDLMLVGYLVYLRRQVRIEQEVRQRRLDRAARSRAQGRRTGQRQQAEDSGDRAEDDPDDGYEYEYEAREEPPPPRPAPRPRPPVHPGTAIVDVDDEDPALHELSSETATSYRRAVGQ